MPEHASHIKSLKDVKEVNLTANPAYSNKAKTNEAYDESETAPYICPIVGLEMSGKFRFILVWSCGCIFSERALKEVGASSCHKCQKPFTPDDVIVLNGTDEDNAVALQKMHDRKAKTKSEKKNKKRPDQLITTPQTNEVSCLPSTSSQAAKEDINNADKKKNPEMPVAASSSNGKLPTKRGTAGLDIVDPKFKKTRVEYSVAKDPNASSVYKSLFTTHQNAINQDRAHWVTYNPFYN